MHCYSMTLTMSGPDRLQEQLRRDPEFLRRFYLDSQMQLNARLEHHNVTMVNDQQYLSLYCFYFQHKL